MVSFSDKDAASLPRHIAIIMDGNGRWAQKRGMLRVKGHQEGANAVITTIETCARLGIKTLSLFAFSSENWKRPQSEVNALMQLLAKALKKQTPILHQNGIKVRVLGDLKALKPSLQESISYTQNLTENNLGLKLNIAINYGGKWDIVQACKKLALKVRDGDLDLERIDEELFNHALVLDEGVDLLIRTGGERRISNFLLWQCAYSEFYVTDLLWPDFNEKALFDAIDYYLGRERRFGMTSEQIKEISNGN